MEAHAPYETVTRCRSCGADGLATVLDLGRTPLADALVRPDDVGGSQPTYPLTLLVCPTCGLVQIGQTVPPVTLFTGDYPYYSSVSDALDAHTRAHVSDLVAERGLGEASFVVEVASNDGYLLRHLDALGVRVLGVDPAPGPAEAARAAGIATVEDFFTGDLAERLVTEHGPADVVIGNNVLAHVADLNGFVAGVGRLLAPDGVAEFEFPYVVDLVEHCEFDTVYHEHLCYFSVTALVPLFARHGLTVRRVLRLPIHGGSLRVTVGPGGAADDTVAALLDAERRDGVDTVEHYQGFGTRVNEVRTALRALLFELREADARVAAYGAAAKGSTLLHVCGIHDLLEYVVDRNPVKQGWRMPGSSLPISPPERLLEDRPDFVLLLAWNFAQEIVAQQHEYQRRGGQFILPVPEPRVL